MSAPTRCLLPALALTVGLAGCVGTDEVSDAEREQLVALRAEVDALKERDSDREDRLAELEAATERLERDDPFGRITDAEEELVRLVDALTVLEEELATVAAADAERVEQATETDAELAQLREATTELREAIAVVEDQAASTRGRVDRVGGELEELQTLFTTLRDRLDRLQRDG